MTETNVFLNVPFDRKFERPFVALVVGVVAHGGIPRCVLELPSSKQRLARLLRLIRSCDISFHDLSRVQSTRTTHGLVPRFNMPFELGLAVMHDRRFFVLEERPYRLLASLSDLNGFDPLVHHNDPRVVLSKLRDALRSTPHSPTQRELVTVYERVRDMTFAQLRRDGADLFSRSVFDELRTLATVECRNLGLL